MRYILPEPVYTALKWACLIAIPAVSWAYAALAPEWGWPMPDQIAHTLDIIGTLIGILIGVSQATAKELDD